MSGDRAVLKSVSVLRSESRVGGLQPSFSLIDAIVDSPIAFFPIRTRTTCTDSRIGFRTKHVESILENVVSIQLLFVLLWIVVVYITFSDEGFPYPMRA